MDSSVLCEIQLLEGGRLLLFHGSFIKDDHSSVVAITIRPIVREEHVDLRALVDLHGRPGIGNSYILKASKDGLAKVLFDRVALLENVEVGELRLVFSGARMGNWGRLSDGE